MEGPILYTLLVMLIVAVAAGLIVRSRLRVPSRHYEGPASVSSIYDHWTQERILEFYWGEHLHAGYYGNPPVKKDFIAAKIDLIEEMIHWGIARPAPTIVARLEQPDEAPRTGRVRILDVGCGLGGSTRYLAKRWPKTAHVTGITISKAQAQRATLLARAQAVDNVAFLECDALGQAFADGSFDIVWAVESEPHIPDKERYMREMVRVLKPGGVLIIAAWNVRDTRRTPLSKTEVNDLQYLLDEWCHAKFISIQEYVELFEKNGLRAILSDDWAEPTQPSWRQGVLVILRDPRGLARARLDQLWGLARDGYTLLRFDAAFRKGLCEYGLIRGQKAG